MKPIVIIKETNKDGKFELTDKELRELIEQAYEQGFEDGKAQYTMPAIPYPYTYPYWAEKGEPIPCWLNQTSGQPNPAIKLNGSAVSTGV